MDTKQVLISFALCSLLTKHVSDLRTNTYDRTHPKTPMGVACSQGEALLLHDCLHEQISLFPTTMCTLSLSTAAEGDLWSESRVWCCLLLSIFKHHCIFFSLSLAVGELKASLSKWFFLFFFALFSPVCLRHMATWHMLCVLCAETASEQTKHTDTHGQSTNDGWELSQSTGHWVRHSGQMIPLTEQTIGTVDPVMYRHRKEGKEV